MGVTFRLLAGLCAGKMAEVTMVGYLSQALEVEMEVEVMRSSVAAMLVQPLRSQL
jgi:hypothetical protein